VENNTNTGTPAAADDDDGGCASFRALVSASLDGDATTAEEAALEQHLDGCADCAAYRDRSAALTRKFRLRSSAPDPAFVAAVMADPRPARLGRGGWARPVLAWCAIVLAFQSFGPLVLGDVDGAPAHVARHLGASSLALACGLLYAAWRPHRAYGLLPFVGALTAVTVIAALVDTIDGRRSALAEATHLAEIVGTIVLWMVAGSPGLERISRRMHARRRLAPGALRSTS
jgi:predicted anti-sigma-YlaC factor YlaD